MQFEMGISTRRYLPASGTAGLERSLVSGNKRLPCPPPITTASTLLTVGVIRMLCISEDPFQPLGSLFYNLREEQSASCIRHQPNPLCRLSFQTHSSESPP